MEDARARLADRVEKGESLKKIPVSSSDALDAAKKEYSKWSAYNNELLKQLFTNDELAEEYSRPVSFFLRLESPHLAWIFAGRKDLTIWREGVRK